MQLAKIQLARSIWLFDVAELNPFGANVEPLIKTIIQRYGFTSIPKPEEMAGGSGKFSVGKFTLGSEIIDVNLEIHADGLIADTRHSTDISDSFLQDLVNTIGTQFSVTYPPRMAKKRAYRSEVIVYAERGLDGLCDRLDQFAKTLSVLMNSEQRLSAVVFGSESKTSAFTFERKINVPYEENRFYSTALVETSTHMALLEEFERLLIGVVPSA